MIIAIVLAGFCFAASIAGLVRDSPLRMALLHNGAWTVALAVYATGWLRFDRLSDRAWLLIAASILIFNLCVSLAARRASSRRRPEEDRPRRTDLLTVPGYLFICALFFTGFGLYLQMIVDNFGLDTLLQDPRSIRASESIAYMAEFSVVGKLLYYLGPLCMVLGIFPKYVRGLKKHAWRLPLVALIALAQLASLQRTNLFVGLVWILGLMLLELEERSDGRMTRRLVGIVLAVAVGVIAFQGMASLLGKTATSDTRVTYAVDPGIRDSPWLSMMIYASSGIPAFSALVESDLDRWPPEQGGAVYGEFNPQTYGAATFSGPMRVVPGVRRWNEVAPFTTVPHLTNVYTWLEPWYRDFRSPGVLIGSGLMGLLAGSLGRLRVRGPEYQLLAALVLGLSGLATFVNRYGMVMTIVSYMALAALGLASRRRWAREQRVRQPAPQRGGSAVVPG